MTDWQEHRFEDLHLRVRVRPMPPLKEAPDYLHAMEYEAHDTLHGRDMIVSGYILWDGCSNHDFKRRLHACSREDMARLGALYDRLFDLAIQIMPGHEEYLARATDRSP